jgi:hypothetical protein
MQTHVRRFEAHQKEKRAVQKLSKYLLRDLPRSAEMRPMAGVLTGRSCDVDFLFGVGWSPPVRLFFSTRLQMCYSNIPSPVSQSRVAQFSDTSSGSSDSPLRPMLLTNERQTSWDPQEMIYTARRAFRSAYIEQKRRELAIRVVSQR